MSQILVFTPYILIYLVFLGRGIWVQNTMSGKHRDSRASPSTHTTFPRQHPAPGTSAGADALRTQH